MSKDFSKIDRSLVNNDYFDQISHSWDHAPSPVLALLRAEGLRKVEWVRSHLKEKGQNTRLLDVGCGGGLLTNALASDGFQITGVDQSEPSLQLARKDDRTGRVQYLAANAYHLPFEKQEFDVITCFDFLEHVSEPRLVLSEISRLLKPGGLFFYHTFNRNFIAWLIAIKGVEWFVADIPKNLHKLSLFIKPQEIEAWLKDMQFVMIEKKGLRPQIFHKSFWKLLNTGQVDADFQFLWTNSRLISYVGLARAAETKI